MKIEQYHMKVLLDTPNLNAFALEFLSTALKLEARILVKR